MKDILRDGIFEYAIHDWFESDRAGIAQRVQFHHLNAARTFLRNFLDDYANRMVLRDVLARNSAVAGMSSVSHHDVVEQIARKIITGELHVEALPVLPPTWHRGGVGESAEEAAEDPAPDTPKERHWIDFRIIDDDTEQPVGDVTLKIKLPTGETRDFRSDPDGMIMIKDIDAGTCDIVQMRDPGGYEVVGIE